MNLKILIIEDEPLIAKNIAMYLNNNNYEVSGIAYEAVQAMHQLKRNPPDFAIVDINLESGMDGIEVADYINKFLNIPFIFLTSYSDSGTIERAKDTKPCGFIVKPFNEKTLYATIEIGLANHAANANKHVPALSFQKINHHLIASLTQREFEVLKLMYEGKTNQQMIQELYISINTLKKHINSAYFKLDVTSRTTAIAMLRTYMLR